MSVAAVVCNTYLEIRWALEHIMYLEVNVNKYAAMGGSSYIKLPKFIENKKAVINVNNQDQHCFLWAIVSALYPPNNRRVNEVSSYPHYSNVFDTQGSCHPKLIAIRRHQEHDCNYIRTDIPSAEYRKDKCGNSVPGNILKFDNNYEKQMVLYRGADAARVFVDRLESDVIEIYEKYLKYIKFMNPLSREEQDQFDRATSCGICEKPLGVGQSKAKDHDHLTGKFRFAAHTNCNLNYKIPNFIPIICHNMSGYDIHMFIKQLFSENSTVDVIAQSKEKYISITKHLHWYITHEKLQISNNN
ncbi:hypothetical protein NQ315_016581 [Exocentrus adspersus]|uniref:DNA-directed DNA polymerase n=1 Tax=Exocentrus adspersus TaxID=1586481 RepID=A0AAV8VD80_9CUCU|nr:hypothetical protein NQ315_016581 [Exocentrus adspersus]